MKNIIWLYSLAISLFYIFVIGIISGVLIEVASDWYLSLVLPKFYPANFMFSIGWGIVYILFALLISLIIAKQRKNIMAYFYIISITVLNILWCVAFFHLHSIIGGLIILIVQFTLMLFLINNQYKYFENVVIATLIAFWYAFALTLNYSIMILN